MADEIVAELVQHARFSSDHVSGDTRVIVRPLERSTLIAGAVNARWSPHDEIWDVQLGLQPHIKVVRPDGFLAPCISSALTSGVFMEPLRWGAAVNTGGTGSVFANARMLVGPRRSNAGTTVTGIMAQVPGVWTTQDEIWAGVVAALPTRKYPESAESIFGWRSDQVLTSNAWSDPTQPAA